MPKTAISKRRNGTRWVRSCRPSKRKYTTEIFRTIPIFHFHEWRKRVKDIGTTCDCCEICWPEVIDGHIAALNGLATARLNLLFVFIKRFRYAQATWHCKPTQANHPVCGLSIGVAPPSNVRARERLLFIGVQVVEFVWILRHIEQFSCANAVESQLPVSSANHLHIAALGTGIEFVEGRNGSGRTGDMAPLGIDAISGAVVHAAKAHLGVDTVELIAWIGLALQQRPQTAARVPCGIGVLMASQSVGRTSAVETNAGCAVCCWTPQPDQIIGTRVSTSGSSTPLRIRP